MKEIDISQTLEKTPNLCIKCGESENLVISEQNFSYKTIIAVVGSFVATFFSFGMLSFNLSYGFEHNLKLRFCSNCLRKTESADKVGLIVSFLFFIFGGAFLFVAIFIDDYFHKSANLSYLMTFSILFWLIDNILLIALISMFLMFMLGLIARWVVAFYRKPKVLIARNYVIIKIPNNRTFKIKNTPKLSINIG